VKQHISEIRACDVNGSFVRYVTEINREGGEVGRVQSPDASLPESKEVNRGVENAGGSGFGPIQVDTEPGDDKEEIYSGKCEMNNETGNLREPRFPAALCGSWSYPESVISYYR
jgi:hypothetical protein